MHADILVVILEENNAGNSPLLLDVGFIWSVNM